ncbi:hypothetical protein D6833_01915, partial [Candidatus Parcubacteria bacterium]
DAVLQWKENLRNHPIISIAKSVCHTLFAPYPWAAIYPGLTWISCNELYYPGVLLWICCLPGILMGSAVIGRKRDPAGWLVLVFLAAMLSAYTLFFGEWSTRQRVFALPAFFALAGVGWPILCSRWLRWRIPLTENVRST